MTPRLGLPSGPLAEVHLATLMLVCLGLLQGLAALAAPVAAEYGRRQGVQRGPQPVDLRLRLTELAVEADRDLG